MTQLFVPMEPKPEKLLDGPATINAATWLLRAGVALDMDEYRIVPHATGEIQVHKRLENDPYVRNWEVISTYALGYDGVKFAIEDCCNERE